MEGGACGLQSMRSRRVRHDWVTNTLVMGLKPLWLGSVQFSHSATSDSLWPHGLQHTRLPCPSPTPGACSNSCPLSRWCIQPSYPLPSPSPPSTEIWIKDLLSMAPPIRTIPSFLYSSLSHQETSISLLPLSLQGRTGWKPQSQKTNQTDHMDHGLV